MWGHLQFKWGHLEFLAIDKKYKDKYENIIPFKVMINTTHTLFTNVATLYLQPDTQTPFYVKMGSQAKKRLGTTASNKYKYPV